MITIINYGAGNLFSVEKAFAALGAEVRVSSRSEDILSSDQVVLPGVGAFGDCMKQLKASGLIPAIKESVEREVPLLGICVGLQILFEGSDESSGVEGLNLLRGHVHKISAPHEKIPHMGWNALDISKHHRETGLFHGLSPYPYVCTAITRFLMMYPSFHRHASTARRLQHPYPQEILWQHNSIQKSLGTLGCASFITLSVTDWR